MKITPTILALGVFCLAGCTGQNTVDTDNAPVIRIATEGAYAPFNYIQGDGSLGGYDVEVAQALCDEMGAVCEISAQDWDGIIPALLSNKYDAIVAGMSVTPERLEAVDFSAPYFKNTLVWIADDAFNPQDIAGLTLGSQRATSPAGYLEAHFAHTNDIRLYDTYENAYLDLAARRTDAVLAEKASGANWLASATNVGTLAMRGDEIEGEDIAIAVRKSDPLKAKLDTALATLSQNGTLAALQKTHFGAQASVPQEVNPS